MPEALHLQRLQVSSIVTFTLRKAQLHYNLQTWSFSIIRFIGGSETTSFGAKDFTFSLWAVSNDTTIEREVSRNISLYQTIWKSDNVILNCLFVFVCKGSHLSIGVPDRRHRRHPRPLCRLLFHDHLGWSRGYWISRANDHVYCIFLSQIRSRRPILD